LQRARAPASRLDNGQVIAAAAASAAAAAVAVVVAAVAGVMGRCNKAVETSLTPTAVGFSTTSASAARRPGRLKLQDSTLQEQISKQ